MASLNPLFFLIPLFSLLAVSMVAVVMLVKRALRDANARLDTLLGGQPVLLRDPTANFFGLLSRGRAQTRGNGALGLSKDTLAFVIAMGSKPPLLIRRAAIQKVERKRSHLGKSIARDLLSVHFIDEQGQPDEVAFYVRELDRWLLALR